MEPRPVEATPALGNRSSNEAIPPIGVLVVHGIGSQKQGSTLDKFVGGVVRAFPEARIEKEGDIASVSFHRRVARCYEVYWADLLENDRVLGTFDSSDVHVLAWFPRLNLKAGLYNKPSKIRVLIWTCILGPAAISIQLIYLVIAMATRGRVKKSFDRTVADVTNYANSAGGATPEGSPVESAAVEIDGRFRGALRRAHADGCREVFVVAHSLGTVIAYHALTNHLQCDMNATDMASRKLVTKFFTIGSPLEKFRFIWPTLVGLRPIGGGKNEAEDSDRFASIVQWENFRNPLDLVSGRLRHKDHWGQVNDHRLFGRAGLARAHVVYEQDPTFVGAVGKALFESPPPKKTTLLRRLGLGFAALIETAIVLALPLLGLAIGVALSLAFALVASVFSASDVALQSGGTGDTYWAVFEFAFKITFVSFVLGLYIIGPIVYGRYRATSIHYAYTYRTWPSEQLDDRQVLVFGETAKWLFSRDRWWIPNRPLRPILQKMMVGLVLAAMLSFGTLLAPGFDGDSPLEPGLSGGLRILSGVYALILGLGVFWFIGILIYLATLLIDIVVQTYKFRRQNTTRPPK